MDAKVATIDKLAWLLVSDRRVLFVRPKGKSYFVNAGGKREEDETDEEALLREVWEELKVKLLAESIAYAHTFRSHAPDGRPLVSTCYFANYTGELKASGEIAGLAWFTTADGERTTKMGRLILAWLKEMNIID